MVKMLPGITETKPILSSIHSLLQQYKWAEGLKAVAKAGIPLKDHWASLLKNRVGRDKMQQNSYFVCSKLSLILFPKLLGEFAALQTQQSHSR